MRLFDMVRVCQILPKEYSGGSVSSKQQRRGSSLDQAISQGESSDRMVASAKVSGVVQARLRS